MMDFAMFDPPAAKRTFDAAACRLRRSDGRFTAPQKRGSVATLEALGYKVRQVKGGRDVTAPDGETALQSASLSRLERFARERYERSTKGGNP